jgi:hypothetical protein
MRVRTPIWGLLWGCACLLAGVPAAGAATIAVPAGGDLQAALNAAQPGDVITLTAGATYAGNFVLPNKGAIHDYITVRSAAPDAELPRPGVRMTPAYAALLPKIKSTNNMSALRTATAANHWKLLFLEFEANVNGYGDIIALGAGDSSQTQLSQVPYALVVDRVYVHGDPVLGQKRGISLHSSDTTVINSYISECKAIGQDSQAISGFNGPGNYLIENNYLEGATENFLLGGSDPTISGLVTTNVTFRRNHLRKPLSWRDPIMATPAGVAATATPGGGTLAAGTYFYKVIARAAAGQTNKASSKQSAEVSATIAAGTTGGVTISWTPVAGADDYIVYGRATGAQTINWKTTAPYFTDTGAAGSAGGPPSGGTKWSVKNIFELKNAQDVLVEGNVFENLWMADQPGYPIVFTPRNQGGGASWVVVQRVRFQHNLIRHTAGGVNVLGTDNVAPSQRTNDIVIRHNVFDDMTSATWGSGSRPFMLGDGPDAVKIDHNTVNTTDSTIVWFYGGTATAPTLIPQFEYTNNMSAHNSYGIFGSSFSSGLPSTNAYAPDAIIKGNVLAGGNASKYPAGNFLPTVAAWQGHFANFTAGDYHLIASSTYRNAGTDGVDLGADVAAVDAQAANALSGDNSVPPGNSRIRITTTSLPNGMVGQSYAQSILCAGGAGACVWQLRDSALPAGLAFDAVAGIVSGTPSDVQTGKLTIEAYDSAWPTNTATATLAVTIDPPPFVVSVPAAPAAQVDTAFALTAAVSGALGAPTWTIASGALPSGVELNALSGVIAGTPKAWGSFTSLVEAHDSWAVGRTAAQPVAITVAPAALAINPPWLANATYHAAYAGALSATGGTGATIWSVTGGALPEGVTLDANGSLAGTPSSIGAFTIAVQARDANWTANVATANVSITVDAPAFSISVPESPAAAVGQSYALAAAAHGNVGAVAWTIASGTLPAGLTLDAATGAIAGTPSAWGTSNVVVQGVDTWDSGRVAAKPLSITVAPTPLAITTASLAAATYRSAYQASLSATGGTGAIVWSVASGTLPAGVTLDATGAIAGTPTEVGTFVFAAHGVDTNWTSDTDTKTLTLVVQPPAFSASIPATALGRVGLPLEMASTATGEVGTVIWSIASGALPAGVTLHAATGLVSGVSASFGSFTAVVQATDSWNSSRVASGSTTLTIAPTPIVVSTTTLAGGSVRQAYQATLAATGGTGATTWTLKAGVLPDGLTLAANGVVGGTPTAAGTFSFTVEAVDAGWARNAASQALSIVVSAREIVLHAADATRIAGTWSVVADAAAASGARIWNPDAAAPKLTTPLPNPANYFELTFQAEAGVAYHLWMRGKADKNAWANDSVYVQYSGSVDTGGAAVNRIGTASAAALSIEDGINAGLAGWGWADDSYGGFAGPVYFAATGAQTIRVQVREDGLSLDQIVLSADKYATKAPGVTKNDTTLLPSVCFTVGRPPA